MIFSGIIKKDGRLGVATKKRRLDLPLSQSPGTGFLTLLMGLMTFLTIISLSSFLALTGMTDRWSSGLENQATIEIPSEDENGKIRSHKKMEALSKEVTALLRGHPEVKKFQLLSREDIHDLVKPWIGEDLTLLEEMPLPELISISFHEANPKDIEIMAIRLQSLSPNIVIDTHENWLNDLLRFTGSLKFVSGLLVFIVIVTTVTAIAGAMRSRMAIHNDQVSLLHIMGASDSYIAKQFQYHSCILALKGSITGAIFGALTLTIIGLISGEMDVSLLPAFKLSALHIMILISLPFLIVIIATLTARQTVLNVLAKIP